MIKGLVGTVVFALLAGIAGIGLFFVKHEVKEQEARLAELNQEIRRSHEAIHVLKAEWSYLNDPARLRSLSERFLGMKVMVPAQVATLQSLNRDEAPAAAPVAAIAVAKPAAAASASAAKPEPVARPQAVVAAKPPQAVVAAKPPQAVVAAKPPQAVVAAKPAPLQPRPVVAEAPIRPNAQAAQTPARTIVIQSPNVAQSQSSGGEVR
ncbi:energy transducer TonB [Magnetospirillum sp. UT-4]|uniref:cell division protein FtsL n=1 Tax=Magnetospirillum sp. UT-4 TaxID=2681467 RepID=UPI0013818BC5|nr:energy transducer TonB [Magnetospirillum sp. UT-4]CAA7618530.1 Periplasmic protein TonB (modular protein) [Magnetospirillum sp. UT-4]